jgi:uncharacterized protein
VSKKKAEKSTGKRPYMKIVAIVAAVVIAVIALYWYATIPSSQPSPQPAWSVDANGHITFAARGQVVANSTLIDSNANYTLESVNYASAGEDVYALLRIPKNVTKPPVVIVLPAASITKENDSAMANALAGMGYASLTLDERGNNGQTLGDFAADVQTGYNEYAAGQEPVQYKQAYDVLKGYDYLKTRPDLDGNDTAVLGESMGGRFAIISCAIEPGLKGAVVISSANYGLQSNGDPVVDTFIKSVEPGNYVSMLPPRRLAMFHFTNDTVIPVADARSLYDSAQQPKAWHEYNGSIHGLYNDVFAGDLHDELKLMLGR